MYDVDLKGMSFTQDMLLNGKVKFQQPVKGYRVAIDTVLVAAAVPAVEGSHVLELGAGVGAASLCLLARVAGCHVDAIECQKDLAALARTNAELNGVVSKMTVHERNILSFPGEFSGKFDHVMINPPYLQPRRASCDAKESISTVEHDANLGDWVSVALKAVRRKGSLTFIHRADRLDELLMLIRGRTGGIVVAPVWAYSGREAKRVIVQALKGVSTPLRLSSGITLHESDGAYTVAAEEVLRNAAAINFFQKTTPKGISEGFVSNI